MSISNTRALQAAPAPSVSASLPTTASPVLNSVKPVLNMVGLWFVHAYIAANNFIYKSMSNFAFNIAIGCGHACTWCYVPSASTKKQGDGLAEYGVTDPDAQWGQYVLLRTWDEAKFLSSLRAAENIPDAELKRDGNRAIIFCSTTDGWQVIRHPDPVEQKKLNEHRRHLVRRALELIRDRSSLNVRVLTRSPLAREDFDLFKTFGPRLTFGMSLPTLNNNLAKIYEPKAPAPSQRLATLRAAKAAGLHVFVAIAPTYPECDEADLRATLTAVAELDPLTVFMEPINVRAENLARMKAHADEIGATINTSVFETPESWQDYALGALHAVERLAGEVGLSAKLHLWPDADLGTEDALNRVADPVAHQAWLNRCWSRISEWPTS
jgi:DNA repair photolyase